MPLTGGDIRLERSHDGRVANLTLDHGRFNIITMETRALMAERFAEIDADKKVAVVVIRGEGEHFTSGGDIAGFMEVEPYDLTDLGQDVTAAARSPKPVITAVDGYCFGVGFELALATDIRLATARSEFALPEMRLGMMPGSGGTQRLARLIGLSRAKYHVLTAERIKAQQALDWGLLASVSEDGEGLEREVERVVSALLGYSPVALRTAKEVLDRGVDAPLASGVELERKSYAMLRATHDFAEGVAAFGEKRAPKFTGR
ncbi:enoyl-CoA hydratase/isomerase family protein [Georgenia subflava]|uniref:Enoyl-CoA hydratase/isomerase family protein n=1 Tax=Georgenia subflava TaxID=1622177 RepID=A0A6N7EAT0_9MICO|nr:enoyl-CoA hydratase/isomerase family protein [Georgenia subflava]MPV35492.1 enoyl-CoA hydratase/isomerase family protein [Georgenia subflava]